MFNENQFKEVAEARKQRQDFRFKCLELAARMIGPQPAKPEETVQQYLNRYIPLSNVIEQHITNLR